VADSAYELNETFRLALTGGNTATVTITDDDSANKPTYTVTPAVSATEGQAGTADFTVTLSTAAVASVTLQVAVADGTTSAGDYSAPSTVVIASGATTGTISITINNDNVYEGTETASVDVSLGGETNVQGGPHSGTLTITDDETVPTVTLNATGAAEGGTINVIATPSGPAEHAMSYSLTLAGDGSGGNDPADSGDYTDSGAAATIPAATAAGSPVTLRSIPVAADTIDENAETLRVTVHNATYSTADVASLYPITDDPDDVTPTIVVDDLTTAETGTAQVVARLDYGNGNGATTTEKTLTAAYATADGTAKAPGDYTATSGTVTFDTAGVNSTTIGVPIAADALYETDETFRLALTGGNTATVTITDDDLANKPAYTVTAAATGTEGQAGTTDFTVTLGSAAAADITLNVSVIDVTTSHGLASAGGDDYSAPSTVTIRADQTTATVPVTITDDSAYEGTETATVRVSLAGGEPNATGSPQDGTLTITDNESVPALTLATDTAAEGANLTISGTPSGVAERDMVYSLALAGDGTGGNDPAESADYVDSGAPYTLARGTAAGTPVTLRTFAASADTADEATETVKATVHNDTYGTPDVSALYRITDDPNDLPPAVSLADVTVAEGAGNASVPVTLTFDPNTNAATRTERPVVLGFETETDTAGTNDFGAPVTINPLTIAAGATSGTILVPIVDDARNELSEAFHVNLTSVTPAEATTTTATSVVTITDNDQNAPRPTFAVSNATVGEAAGSATFTVTLSGVAADDVDLTVAAADVTATEAAGTLGGNDYDPPAGTLTIAQGRTTGTFTVPVNQDNVYEGDETARLTVTLAVGERDAVGNPQQAVMTIQDDEARPSIALNPVTGAEGASVPVGAVLNGPVAQRDLLLGAASTTGTGTSPAESNDYDATGIITRIPAGTPGGGRVNLGSILLANDTIDEPAETFTLTLAGLVATYTILDDPNDLPPALAVGDATVAENAGTATVSVTPVWSGATTATEQEIKVPWTTAAGTAVAGRDFTAVSGTATIPAFAKSAAIQVPVLDDKVYESDESFTVRLGTGTTPAGLVLSKPTGTVTVKDDDPPTPPTLATPAVPTGSGAVTLTGTADPDVQVTLFAAPGASGGTMAQVAATTADSTGKFTISRAFDTGSQVKVRASGLFSPVRIVSIKQDPDLTASSTTKGVVTLVVTGDPKTPGQPVELQRLVNGAWSTVATGPLTSTGTFATTLKNLTSGAIQSYRALIWGTTANAINGGISPTRQITVK
jgi:hypothetical protein